MQRAVIVPGNLDGVHRGHQALLEQATKLAAELGDDVHVVAMFFDPHPASVLGRTPPPMLSTPEIRKKLLTSYAAVDQVDFSFELSRFSPERFVEEYFVARNACRAIVCGEDFRYGNQRKGDAELLHALGAKHDFVVRRAEDFLIEGERVSSSLCRQALIEGRVADAECFLGRPYALEGRVVEGQALARTLGFRTANLGQWQTMLPASGVYLVHADVAGKRSVGLCNVGTRPTVDAGFAVETHLLDFDEDIYGEKLTIHFRKRIRDEQKFSGLETLKEAIANDVAKGRELVSEIDPF